VSDPVFDDPRVRSLLELALREDVGAGDRTSEATIPETARARGRFLAKEPLVVCGIPVVERVFDRLGPVTLSWSAADGDHVQIRHCARNGGRHCAHACSRANASC
jgi:nicotinate-nucleotide pyrophosphorylase (carboxylating)